MKLLGGGGGGKLCRRLVLLLSIGRDNVYIGNMDDGLKIPQNNWIKNAPKDKRCTQSTWQINTVINIVFNRYEAYSGMPYIKSSIKCKF
jgi:hypothetical protein